MVTQKFQHPLTSNSGYATDDYEDFESLEKVEKSSYVLGSELWESKCDGLLTLVKEYIVDVSFGPKCCI